MNPQVTYTFKSAKGIDVTITSRMGEDSARSAAMLRLWGPPNNWCFNKGKGLHLVKAEALRDNP